MEKRDDGEGLKLLSNEATIESGTFGVVVGVGVSLSEGVGEMVGVKVIDGVGVIVGVSDAVGVDVGEGEGGKKL